MSLNQIFSFRGENEEEHWVSVSDLMAGLMMIFLFIAIVYMRTVINDAVVWQETETKLYEALQDEFKNDLNKWNAELDKETLSIRFKEPDVLFDAGDISLKTEFKTILGDFFPRYLKVLNEFKSSIEEVRIEGHTSSEWTALTKPDDAYFKNMALSQGRTRAVLWHGLSLADSSKYKEWAKKYLTANGLSSSQPILFKDGSENKELSRRVEFRVRTNAKEKITQILSKVPLQ